ncbi:MULTISPECIES: exopolysaccharide biosynthesis protein [unclassified Cobetia]|uniref:exopolysaccharide biosynthesis protein n=1 Tax=unclassified Cobetia TaxID=2609414 RepID=UPI00178CBE7C|nr:MULTISPECIES: exopolysaccharide biosynthesis protein [unclassified Cobetia]MBE2168540.1 exopolysaccharide biosynthesis protein [Cobetia sp. 2AS1]MDH2445919.1 exopolysaccharide biosynthesis protein [Cobetia sp. 2AS]
MSKHANEGNLTGLLEELDREIEGDISLGDILEHFNSRGFGPLLVLPALLVLLPTGAIPGVPTTCALFIVLIAGQLLLGRKMPWLPRRLACFSFEHQRLTHGVERARPWTRRLDRLLKPRLSFMTRGIAYRGIAALTILLATAMVPLELVPFAAALPAATLLLLGLGLIGEDGLIILLALLVLLLDIATGFWLVG